MSDPQEQVGPARDDLPLGLQDIQAFGRRMPREEPGQGLTESLEDELRAIVMRMRFLGTRNSS